MTDIVIGSGYADFLTYLQQLPTAFTTPSASLFPTPLIDGVPAGNVFSPPTGAITPVQLSTAQIALKFSGPPVEYALFQGTGLSFPINGKSLASLGGTITGAQLYSGGTFGGGAVTGGTLLASLTLSDSQYVLTIGDTTLTLSGSGLPTSTATVQALLSGTYTGPSIGISHIVADNGSTKVTLDLSATTLDINVVNPDANVAYELKLTGQFPTALTAAQIDALVKGQGFVASGPVGITQILYNANANLISDVGSTVVITLSPTTLDVTADDYDLALTGTFSALGLTADQLTTLVNGGALQGAGFTGSVTSAVVTQISTGDVVESTTSPTPGGDPLNNLYIHGTSPQDIGSNLFKSIAGLIHTETVGSGQTWTVSSGNADFNDNIIYGGFEVVSSGGVTSKVVLYGTDSTGNTAALQVFSGGVAGQVDIGYGAGVGVQSGAVIDNVVVEYGGSLTLRDGATGSGIDVRPGGVIQIYDGASLTKVNIEPGAIVSHWHEVLSGENFAGGVVSSGLRVDSGGSATGVTIAHLGRLNVFGTATSTTLAGVETLQGIDFAANVISGGDQIVFPTGVASGATVLSGGLQNIQSGGVASDTRVSSGGSVSVQAGGVLDAVVVLSGGRLNLRAATTVSGLTLSAGAVVDFAQQPNLTFLAGSALQVMSGATLVESIALTQGLQNVALQVRPDSSGGTLLLALAESFPGLQNPQFIIPNGFQTTYSASAPAGGLLGTELVTVSGGQSITQYLGSTGVQFAANIRTDLGGGSSELQDFNGAWSQKDATITYNEGAGSTLVETFDSVWNHTGAVFTYPAGAGVVVQTFDGAFHQLTATITSYDAPNGLTVSQTFDSAWNQTGAVRVQSAGGTVQTQYFNSAWQQTSASIVTSLGGGTVETQYFDANWKQTSAMLVGHPDAATTVTQYFDANWKQTSADIVTISGAVSSDLPPAGTLGAPGGVATTGGAITTDQHFDGSWGLLGGTVTVSMTATEQLVQTYDSGWNRLVGADRLIVDGTLQREVFNGSIGLPTTFVFSPGQIDGDAFAGFINGFTNSAAHDVLAFVGYGPGAALTQIDPSHWQITAPGHATEVFTLSGGLNLVGGDVVFK